MLGGTGVMVKFQSQSQGNISEEIICSFDGIEVNGTLVNSTTALCISPQLSRAGQVPFLFRISEINFIYESIFTSCKCLIVLQRICFRRVYSSCKIDMICSFLQCPSQIHLRFMLQMKT